MTGKFPLAAALLGLAWGQAAQASDIRATAEVACEPGGKALEYACDIRLSDRRTGAPLEGLEVTVGATMPSMPMAHNVRPVQAEPGQAPGSYSAVLELEMYGIWAVQLDLAGPVRDRLVATLDFQPADGGDDEDEAGSDHGGHGGHGGQHRH